ncbi:MAG: carboxypeptidase regulatory-like domain-containing protein [Thermogutta sp.]|uniref:carboxypeptidase-like regulatory domain-containing protein n=1 Tax=Thermogutta sp. TaxID=1962930 RepID=UPI00198800C2|nr:carboxypeptidase-like regulatory domain-containing protein [Thermogutta sp.]MBC7352014.1 carboxypeptidase regulatory-like domain-containing protein [Thermogutta sp.]
MAGCWFVPRDSWTAVEGVVVDDAGAPVPGATVTLRPEPGQEKIAFPDSVSTDEKGCFRLFQGHAPVRCNFIVEAKKEGFLGATMTVQGCRSHQVRLVLVPERAKAAATPGKMTH